MQKCYLSFNQEEVSAFSGMSVFVKFDCILILGISTIVMIFSSKSCQYWLYENDMVLFSI